MKPRTLNDIFFGIVDRRQQRLMLAREATEWLPISSPGFLPQRGWSRTGSAELGCLEG